MKKLTWLAESRSTGKSFPSASRTTSALRGTPHGQGGRVIEIAARNASGTDRAVSTVSPGDSIYVPHAFQKKSKSGIATPKPEMEWIRQRLKQLRSEAKNAEK